MCTADRWLPFSLPETQTENRKHDFSWFFAGRSSSEILEELVININLESETFICLLCQRKVVTTLLFDHVE